MKSFYFNIFCIVLFFLSLANTSNAQYIIGNKQIDTTFNNRMNFLFAHLETARIPYGLLRDYAFEFTNLETYNGNIIADSTMIDRGIFWGIYNTLVTSIMTTGAAGTLPDPELVDSLWFRSRQPGYISLAGLFYSYARFSDNAYTSGKITSSNEQVYDVYNNGAWQNPYTVERTIGFAPSTNVYNGLNFNLHFTDSLWLSNSKNMVDHIEVDMSDGSGYRTLTPGIDLPVSYADSGLKVWNFKIILTDNSILQSHTKIQVNIDPYGGNSRNNNNRGGISTNGVTPTGNPSQFKVVSSETYLGLPAKGMITLQYAPGHTTLQNPLIVVEGYDPGIFTSPEDPAGNYTLKNYNNEVRNSASLQNLINNSYDIVFVDYQNGVDDIRRNALLVKEVIHWVNNNKTGNNPNVVLGLSMGGVVSRYALKKMEDNNELTQVRLFVSHDSPQQGANIPLGYQYFLHHINNIYFRSGISGLYNLIHIIKPSLPNVNGLLSLTEAPASKQMLINHINPVLNLDNGIHDTWQNELTLLGYPNQCRNVAISNGSECGTGQSVVSPSGQLLLINGQFHPNFLQSLFGLPALALISFQPVFFSGIIPGRNQIGLHFQVNAGNNGGGNQVYTGSITYQKRFAWFVTFNTTLTSLTRSAFSGALPYDSYGGGIYNTSSFTGISNPSLTVSITNGFCFVPTPSALDISGSPSNLTASDYQSAYVGNNPPASPKNSPFANFVTAFYPKS